jgi:hypothetical protein
VSRRLPCALLLSRYASYLGGTTEWSKWEGMTIDAENKILYVALTAVDEGMLEGKETFRDALVKITTTESELPKRDLHGAQVRLATKACYAVKHACLPSCPPACLLGDADPARITGTDDVRLPENMCGCIYALTMAEGGYEVNVMKGVLCGNPTSGQTPNFGTANGSEWDELKLTSFCQFWIVKVCFTSTHV